MNVDLVWASFELQIGSTIYTQEPCNVDMCNFQFNPLITSDLSFYRSIEIKFIL